VSGFILQTHFRDGQVVEAGELLFTIDPRPFEIAVAAAVAEVAAAEARLALADAEVRRAEPLRQRGNISAAAFDERRFAAQEARASLLSAEASLAEAELDLEWSAVVAPIAGRVSDSRVDKGNLVQGGASGATLLTTLVSLQPIYVEFEGSEADFLRYARQNEAGDRTTSRESENPVEVKLADEDGWPHKGRIVFVDNAIDPRSGTIRARAVLEEANPVLTPGLFARIRLFGGRAEALMIPDSAILADQTRRVAMVVGDDGVVTPRPLELGPIIDGLRVIRGGLAPTDRIVIEGLMRARPGQPVTPVDGEITAAGT
ncbi:MAG: efflux RND transporter periplasmic adaptor subunit, partial [Pseudomonadota bacterium]